VVFDGRMVKDMEIKNETIKGELYTYFRRVKSQPKIWNRAGENCLLRPGYEKRKNYRRDI